MLLLIIDKTEAKGSKKEGNLASGLSLKSYGQPIINNSFKESMWL